MPVRQLVRRALLASSSLIALTLSMGATPVDAGMVMRPPAKHRLMPSPSTVVVGYYWADAKPVLHIASGDELTVGTLITSTPNRLEGAGVNKDDVEPALRAIIDSVRDKGPGGHILTGPVYVDGAEPGDVLEVRIKKVALAIPYAYNAFGRTSGFIPEDFPSSKMRIIPLDAKAMMARWAPGIDIPLHPFFGSIGVAPPPAMGHSSMGTSVRMS